MFVYTTSKGITKMADMRKSGVCDNTAITFVEKEDPSKKNFFTEIVASISEASFSKNGRYIFSRDFLSVKVWDINMPNKPVSSLNLFEPLKSKLCELLDPIADKIIVAAALVLLVMNDIIKNYEVIAAIIILTREILISGLREFLAKSQVVMPVTGLAKFKTFIQMFAIAILLTGESGNRLINLQDYNAHSIGIILLWLSAFLTLYTGYDYIKKGIDHAID